jgi:bifunctional non-homologous end joining protein LigD
VPVRESAGGKKRAMGQGLTAAKMKDGRWLKPVLVCRFEFVEWTPEGHLRHSLFMGLREDKRATDVRWEWPPGSP